MARRLVRSIALAVVLAGCSGGGTASTHAISGTVTGPAAGVTISLTGAAVRTATVDASGAYAFSGLPDGSYTLTPSRVALAFEPQDRSVTLGGADATGQDFAARAIVIAPSSGQRSFFATSAPAPGWLPRFGELVQLDATTSLGTVVTSDAVLPVSWTADGNDVVVSYDPPRTVGFESDSIFDSPAPPDVQSAYYASHGAWITVRVDLVARRWSPVAQHGDTYGIDDAQTQRLTWGPFYLSGQTPYEYVSERTATSSGQLRVRGASPAVPWTPALAEAVWALDAYYAPAGTSFITQAAMPPEYHGDVVTLAADATGESRYGGRTLLWSVNAGYLDLAYPDGSSERLEIVDAGGDVFGLWSEHRDSSGALLAGAYDWAFRTPALPLATAPAFVTGPTAHWQQFVTAWDAVAWDGLELRWDWTFGWELLAGGTGANVQAFFDVAPDGTPTPVYEALPLTWSVTEVGQLRLDRSKFSTGETRKYRLVTPVAIAQDGSHVFAVEEEYARFAPYDAYQVFLEPRLTAYERRPIPPPTPPAP